MPLTDTMIRSAKGGERPVKLTDDGGLHAHAASLTDAFAPLN